MTEIHDIFLPYYAERRKIFLEKDLRFVHYTTADTAIKIIESEEVWLRSSMLMNDSSEIRYGIKCIEHALSESTEYKSVLESIDLGLYQRVSDRFHDKDSKLNLAYDCYLFCVSEHNPQIEDDIGKLSMWRAYGGKSGVAVVLNPDVFFSDTDSLKAFSSPVFYGDEKDVTTHLSSLAHVLENNIDVLKEMPITEVENYLYWGLTVGALSIKHKGFQEENEWRVIYCPSIAKSDEVKNLVVVLEGIPQIIHKIELKNNPELGLIGISLTEILDKVIIGPSAYPYVAWKAMVSVLERKNIPEFYKKVFNSQIPLKI